MDRLVSEERGDVSPFLAGAFMTVFLIFVFAMFSNVPRFLGVQETLTAAAQGVAKDVAQNGCLTSSAVTAIDQEFSGLGLSPGQAAVETYVDGKNTTENVGATAQYGANVAATVSYPEPVAMLGVSTPWAIEVVGQGGPEPSQYVTPVSGLSPTCPGWAEPTGVGLGTPNAYVLGDNAFASASVAQTPEGTGGATGPVSGTAGLTASAAPASSLVDHPVEITGTATLSGAAEAGVTVTAMVSGGAASGQAITGASGAYSIPLVFTQAGTFAVDVSDGAATAQTSVTVSAGAAANIEVSAQSPVQDGSTETIYALVTDQNGNPVPDGTKVQVSSTDSQDLPAQTLTTSGGEVAVGVTWSQVGTWGVTFTTGAASATAEVAVDPGAAANVSLSASPDPLTAGESVTLTGTVTDSEGNPVAAGTSVTLSSPTDPGDFPTRTVITAQGGSFAATGAFTVASTQTVLATSGQASGAVTIPVEAGTVSQFTGVLLAPSPATVGSQLAASGTLQDVYGNPVSGATVTMSGAGATQQSTTTAANGTFALAITPTSAGSATVTLTSGSASWSRAVTVNPKQVADSVVAWIGSPGTDTATVTAGATVTVGATVTSGGAQASGVAVTFSQPLDGSPTPATCTTDLAGICSVTLTLTQAGSDVVEAGASGGTGVVDITVMAGPPALVTVAATPTAITAGQTVAMSGRVTDRYGNPVGGLVVTLSDGQPADAVTTATGEDGQFSTNMTLTLAGAPLTVTATSDGVEGTTEVTVTPGPWATGKLYLIVPYVPFGAVSGTQTCDNGEGCNGPAEWAWYAYDAYGNQITNPGYTATYYVGLGTVYFGKFASGVPEGAWYVWTGTLFDINNANAELTVSIQLYDPPYTQGEVGVNPYTSAGPSSIDTFAAP